MSLPGLLLRLEGAAVFVLTVVLYARLEGNWLLFVVLLLAPDVGMLGYLRNSRLGAATYDAFHTYVAPAALALTALGLALPPLLPLALVWAAHIGMDRVLGFGLKYPTQFRDTHLGRV